MTYWAHSDPHGLTPDHPDAQWQPLSQHLQNVAALSRNLAFLAAPSDGQFLDLAEWAGLLHDFGKYTDCFQNMILGQSKGPCPHSVHGASLAFDKLHAKHVSFAIAGHHAGIPDAGKLGESVNEHKSQAYNLLSRAGADCPAIEELLQ